MAEQALRKLMAASKSGKSKALTRDRQGSRRQQDEEMWRETLDAVMQEDEAERKRHAEVYGGWGLDGAADDRASEGLKIDSGMLVNYDRKYWRKAAQSLR